MNKIKKLGIIFVITGTVLILSALSLFFYNRNEDAQAGQEAENLLKDVQSVIQEKEPLSSEMPIIEINGYEYVGYLSIPDLELELPVMYEWDYEKLKISPCRQFGSSRTDDLVIAAHNYKKHFGRLYQLENGAEIAFTDMDGIKNLYEISLIDTIAPNDVEIVQNSGYDLVLYTCTFDAKTRVAVFCNRQDDSAYYSAFKSSPENSNSSLK